MEAGACPGGGPEGQGGLPPREEVEESRPMAMGALGRGRGGVVEVVEMCTAV